MKYDDFDIANWYFNRANWFKSPFSMGKFTVNHHFEWETLWKITIFNGKTHKLPESVLGDFSENLWYSSEKLWKDVGNIEKSTRKPEHLLGN